MKNMLKEEINYNVEKAKNGNLVAFIDPKTSEKIYDLKNHPI